MKSAFIPALIATGCLPIAGQAALIATENFDYPDGSVVGQTGGTGWNYERNDEPDAPAQTASNWNDAFGTHQVISSELVTDNGGAFREFGGITEGTGATNEAEGAFRGTGTMYFSTNFTLGASLPEGDNQWAGVSSYDFGSERLFFGMPGQNTETRFFGIAAPGFGADTISSIPVEAGVTYTLVGMLDFDNDLLALWVNPDAGDTSTSYDVSKAYDGTNWSSALRLASGTSAAWDDLSVGTEIADVSVIPEPSIPLMGLLAATLLWRRNRRG